VDAEFRKLVSRWLKKHETSITRKVNKNLQLHPPCGSKADSNVFTNGLGNLEYPLLFSASTRPGGKKYAVVQFHKSILRSGYCKKAKPKK
jgi:hypothetical protein